MKINFNSLRHACKYQSVSAKVYNKNKLVEEFYCENKKNKICRCRRDACPLNADKSELEKDLCKICDNADSKPLFCGDCESYEVG